MAKKILLIDDETDLLEEIADWLSARGIIPTIASSGQAGLERLSSDIPDLIVCDISMPGMDGFQVLERVRAMPAPIATIPFIFLTAHAAVDDEIKGRGFGADDYVAKPVDLPRLYAVIGSRLSQAERFESAAQVRIQAAQERISKAAEARMSAMEQAFVDLRPLMREASGANVQLISLMDGIADPDWVSLGTSTHQRLKTAQDIVRRAGILAAVPPPPKQPKPEATSIEAAVVDAAGFAAGHMKRGGIEIRSSRATITADPDSLRTMIAAFLVWISENAPRAQIALSADDGALIFAVTSEHRTPAEISKRWSDSRSRTGEAADPAASAFIDSIESHGGEVSLATGAKDTRFRVRFS